MFWLWIITCFCIAGEGILMDSLGKGLRCLNLIKSRFSNRHDQDLSGGSFIGFRFIKSPVDGNILLLWLYLASLSDGAWIYQGSLDLEIMSIEINLNRLKL